MRDRRGHRPNYGIDAPGVLFGLLASGAGLLLVGLALRLLWPAGILAGGAAGMALIGLVPTLLGLSFAAYVRWGKLRARDRMLGRAALGRGRARARHRHGRGATDGRRGGAPPPAS